MFGSTILDLAIGLIFSFLMISLIASAATEAVASALLWRANTLLQGVKDLLNDQNFTGLALDVYNRASVNPRTDGTATTEAQLTAKPSYIDPKQFACALMDIAALTPGNDVQALQAKVNATVADKQLNTMLNGMIVRAEGNINRIRDDIAAWFDSGMERVAGVYKRKTQLWSFAIALFLAVTLNVDSVKIAETLWQQPMLMKDLPPVPTGETPEQALVEMQKLQLPFGWDQKAIQDFKVGPNLLYAVAGWLISAVATLFGAPFWFDSLQKFVQLRGAGAN
jgi:hypothetical protein